MSYDAAGETSPNGGKYLSAMTDYSKMRDVKELTETPPLPEQFSCPDCYFVANSKMGLVSHRRQHSTKKKNMEGAKLSPTGKVEFSCDGCKKVFSYHASKMKHILGCRKYITNKQQKDNERRQLFNIGSGGTGNSGNNGLRQGNSNLSDHFDDSGSGSDDGGDYSPPLLLVQQLQKPAQLQTQLQTQTQSQPQTQPMLVESKLPSLPSFPTPIFPQSSASNPVPLSSLSGSSAQRPAPKFESRRPPLTITTQNEQSRDGQEMEEFPLAELSRTAAMSISSSSATNNGISNSNSISNNNGNSSRTSQLIAQNPQLQQHVRTSQTGKKFIPRPTLKFYSADGKNAGLSVDALKKLQTAPIASSAQSVSIAERDLSPVQSKFSLSSQQFDYPSDSNLTDYSSFGSDQSSYSVDSNVSTLPSFVSDLPSPDSLSPSYYGEQAPTFGDLSPPPPPSQSSSYAQPPSQSQLQSQPRSSSSSYSQPPPQLQPQPQSQSSYSQPQPQSPQSPSQAPLSSTILPRLPQPMSTESFNGAANSSGAANNSGGGVARRVHSFPKPKNNFETICSPINFGTPEFYCDEHPVAAPGSMSAKLDSYFAMNNLTQ